VVRRYPTEPITRAFEHHHAANVPAAFQFVGFTVEAGVRTWVVAINGERRELDAPKAHLVAEALAAGRRLGVVNALRQEA
jgi:hypothetical protein